MLLKYKSFLVGLVVMLGVALALCISSITARADTTIPSGDTGVSATGTYFDYNTSNISTFADVTYVDQYLYNNVYYSTFSTTTDILIPYRFNSKSSTAGQYVNGRVLLSDVLTVTAGTVTGFTLSNLKYTVALIYNSDVNTNVALTANANGTLAFGINFLDYLCLSTSQSMYGGWTISVKVTGLASWSGSSPHRPVSIPINITHSLSEYSQSITLSSTSFEELQIIKALEYSDLDKVYDELITANAHMVWTDGVVVYDVADLLYMNFASQNTANNWLDQIAQASNNTNSTVNSIANNISTDSSGIASSIGSGASSLHTGESNVEGQIDDILSDVIGPSDDFNQALDDIGDVNVGAFVNTHTVPLGFWHNVTQWFIDTSSMGIFSKFLLIILVLGLVTWILAI